MKDEKICNDAWKKFLGRHWKATLLMILTGTIAAVVGLFVSLWTVANAQAGGFVPPILGDWTVGYVITFILNVILWELIFVGSWGIPVVLLIYFQWYKKLPDKEREEYSGKHKHHKTAEKGEGISCFAGLIWLSIVWLEGKWNLAFKSWTFDYWVYSWVAAWLWMLLIVGIPGIIFLIWSLSKKS